MYTRCPHCQTTFELGRADLERASGRVRCGECQRVFDARAALFDGPLPGEGDGVKSSGATDAAGPVARPPERPDRHDTRFEWLALPADNPAAPRDPELARLISGGADEIWSGAPARSTAASVPMSDATGAPPPPGGETDWDGVVDDALPAGERGSDDAPKDAGARKSEDGSAETASASAPAAGSESGRTAERGPGEPPAEQRYDDDTPLEEVLAAAEAAEEPAPGDKRAGAEPGEVVARPADEEEYPGTDTDVVEIGSAVDTLTDFGEDDDWKSLLAELDADGAAATGDDDAGKESVARGDADAERTELSLVDDGAVLKEVDEGPMDAAGLAARDFETARGDTPPPGPENAGLDTPRSEAAVAAEVEARDPAAGTDTPASGSKAGDDTGTAAAADTAGEAVRKPQGDDEGDDERDDGKTKRTGEATDPASLAGASSADTVDDDDRGFTISNVDWSFDEVENIELGGDDTTAPDRDAERAPAAESDEAEPEAPASAPSAAPTRRADERLAAVRANETQLREELEQLSARATGARRRRWYGLATLGLLLLLAVQLVHSQRHELATRPGLHGLLTGIYGALGMPFAPRWNVNAMCVEQHNYRADAGRLVIDARIANRNQRPMPYPLVYVELTDTWESPVAARVLTAPDYLAERPATDAMVAPGQRFRASASLVDPGTRAAGYQLHLCYRDAGGALRCANGCVDAG